VTSQTPFFRLMIPVCHRLARLTLSLAVARRRSTGHDHRGQPSVRTVARATVAAQRIRSGTACCCPTRQHPAFVLLNASHSPAERYGRSRSSARIHVSNGLSWRAAWPTELSAAAPVIRHSRSGSTDKCSARSHYRICGHLRLIYTGSVASGAGVVSFPSGHGQAL
jgi:hypothetical protein